MGLRKKSVCVTWSAGRIFCGGLALFFFSACLWLAAFYSTAKPNFLFRHRLVYNSAAEGSRYWMGTAEGGVSVGLGWVWWWGGVWVGCYCSFTNVAKVWKMLETSLGVSNLERFYSINENTDYVSALKGRTIYFVCEEQCMCLESSDGLCISHYTVNSFKTSQEEADTLL